MVDSSTNALVDQMTAVIESDRNRRNRALWKLDTPWERDNWRALPCGDSLLFVVDPDRPMLSKLLGFDLGEYYSQPEAHLCGRLMINIFKFQQFDDNSYFSPEYCPWWGVVLEVSLFGVPILFRRDRDPWIGSPPLLQDKAALENLSVPKFYTSGLMPQVHCFYDQAQMILGDRMKVVFPTWARGPLCTAMQLRGMDNLLLDMLEDPDFVHRLMRFVTDCRKSWLVDRARFLGQPIQRGLLFNDEVGVPLINPSLYREFVLPYEVELAQFHGGIFYWHSCGNTTPFLEAIQELPGLELFHVGPNTDLEQAALRMKPNIALEICLQDTRDIYDATEEQMLAKLERIVELCGERPYFVRADGFDIVTTAEQDLGKIRRWCEIARKVAEEGDLERVIRGRSFRPLGQHHM